ncbi:DNA cytosine methyltransferase [Acinetobacter bereziniae]|uniref:DNA cytosine methyltransferase n=1 Tax=Acinetobacter bereziniae TaxID=106648 RepID=UPI0021D0E8DA|nr:DNA cytosine methyltransferase [Acinetobacter bereziniae]MCU4435189.1 DNA cytosine methyltransferase [Acinetobacter bereziniae]
MNFNLLPHELIVDNFAGGGGTSTGLEQAFGRPVDIAINHDEKALAMHRANHPETKHYCESVWDVDPIQVTGNQPVGLVWLSPDCKHFSKAKGGKPVEKKIRGLAWVALRWAAKTRPRVIMLENVEEFKTWGRVTEDGKPCPKHKGETFRSFVNALRHQGYEVQWRELRACDYGAPTIRKRFFMVARRDSLPIVWPKPTHGDPSSVAVKSGRLKPWRTAAECIDWSIPCLSIFERKKPLADATLRRVATGLVRFVINNHDPYIVQNTSKDKQSPFLVKFRFNSNGEDIKKPLPTITAGSFIKRPGGAGHALGVCVPVLTECANASSPRCMPIFEPLRTICAQTKGGHHALVTAFLAKHFTGVVGNEVVDTVSTITAKDHNSLVTGTLVKLRNGCIGQDPKEPLHTITSSAGHFAAVQAFLTAFYGNEKDGNSLSDPLRTITAKERFGLVMIKGVLHQIIDIGLRMLQPVELFKAQGFPSTYIFSYGIDELGQTIKLTKTEQNRMVGNSVSPYVAKALVISNFAHEKVLRGAA